MDSTALKKSYFQLLLQHMQRYLRFSAHPTIRYYIIRRIQLVYSLLQETTGVILLDVGCGEGLDVYNLARNYSYAIGIDLSEDALKRASRDNRPANTFFIRGDAESLPLRNESISISLCLDVLEHLPDPRKALKASCNMLSVDGLILVETWNYKSLTARFLGKHWHEYSPPTVLHWFSQESLNHLMDQFDFQLIATGRPLKKLMWKHAKSLILFKCNDFPFVDGIKLIFSTIPDYLSIPYPSEDLFWFLFIIPKQFY